MVVVRTRYTVFLALIPFKDMATLTPTPPAWQRKHVPNSRAAPACFRFSFDNGPIRRGAS